MFRLGVGLVKVLGLRLVNCSGQIMVRVIVGLELGLG